MNIPFLFLQQNILEYLSNMEKVISGIRPTDNLHLGNYFGVMKSFVKMQEEYNCMFFIADWHSLTTHPTPIMRHN